MPRLPVAALLLAAACIPSDGDGINDAVVLTVLNHTGSELWQFQYAECGKGDWFEVIAAEEYVPDGASVSSGEVSPGCYDLRVQNEYGCAAESTTVEEVAGGLEFTWTVTPSELDCP